MAQQKHPSPVFFDDEATRAMSAAFLAAWRAIEAQQAPADERAAAILRMRLAAAILEMSAFGFDCDMVASAAVDRISAVSRFRAG
jgi:hypothetical protein